MLNLFALTCLMVTVYVGIQAAPGNIENRLAKHLVKQYRRIGLRGRPVENVDQTWNVTIKVSLQNIQDVDFATQTMDVLIWQELMWNDAHIKWNKSDFNVDSIRLKPTDIMMPDITLYNAASEPKILNPGGLVTVANNGEVFYAPQMEQKALCAMEAGSKNITCTLKYVSWTYNGWQLDIKTPSKFMSLNSYEINPYWAVSSASATRRVVYYPCCPEPYPDVTFSITLIKRDAPE